MRGPAGSVRLFTLLTATAIGAAAGALTSVGPGLPGGPAAALGAPICSEIPPGGLIAEPSWAQRRLAPERVAPLADGSGVTVAVIDSGVSREHPQLAGRVLKGADFLDARPDGRLDCAGHGTGVASLIAAGPPPAGAGLRGLAPGADILPVRVSEQQTIGGETKGRTASTAKFAEAIRWAVDEGGADVLNLSVVLNTDEPAVRGAIAHAVASDVVVVAAAGNSYSQGNPVPYPAAYDGVLGVGAIGPTGVRQEFSQVGSYVDVVAPGGDVTVAWPDGRYAVQSGTSYATPFVAATAALIRDYRPDLTAREVVRRIVATADPAPGGVRSRAYGSGVVNPYRAVTETVTAQPPERPRPPEVAAVDQAVLAERERRERRRRDGLALAAAGGGVAVLVLGAALVLPRGARRRWRPAPPA